MKSCYHAKCYVKLPLYHDQGMNDVQIIINNFILTVFLK